MKTKSTNKDILKYKEELKHLLNYSDEELDATFKSTLYSFKKKMEDINNDDFITSLMKLRFNRLIEYDKEEDSPSTMKVQYNLYDKNVDMIKDCFLCLCGKSHLKYLYLFTHEDCDEELVIGSSCIQQVAKLQQAYKENQDLVEHLQEIIKEVKTAEIMKNNKPCYKCNDYCIKKDVEYKFPHMKNYCKGCLVGKQCNFVKCSRCNEKVIPASQPMPFDKTTFKEICGKCWHQVNKNETWYKKKYPTN